MRKRKDTESNLFTLQVEGGRKANQTLLPLQGEGRDGDGSNAPPYAKVGMGMGRIIAHRRQSPGGNLRTEKSLADERVADAKSVDPLAVLPILRIEDFTTGHRSSGDNHRIVDGTFVPLRQIEASQVSLQRDRFDTADSSNRVKALVNLRDRHAQLPESHGSKLIEDLDADDPAIGNQFLGPLRLVGIRRKQIKQDVCIEERFTFCAHAQPGGRT